MFLLKLNWFFFPSGRVGNIIVVIFIFSTKKMDFFLWTCCHVLCPVPGDWVMTLVTLQAGTSAI